MQVPTFRNRAEYLAWKKWTDEHGGKVNGSTNWHVVWTHGKHRRHHHHYKH